MRYFMEEAILFICILAIVLAGEFYLVQNVRYGCARNYYQHITYELRKSDFSGEVKDACCKQAKDRGYDLNIKMEDKPDGYVRVFLRYYICFWFFGKKEYIVDGYAR